MKFFTHLAFSFFIGLFAIDFLSVTNSVLFMVILLACSLLPDIDHPDSKIGRFFKPIGWIFTHRGFFHSLLAGGIFALAAYFLFRNIDVVIAVIVGYSSHLVLDAVNHQGIAFFYPFKNRLTGFVKSGGIAEYFLLAAFIGLGVWKLMLFI
jgi:inner membrane protein